ncbi:hypothetical protein TRFO_20129 [Tritrichomonas foetus]|uniref:Uncharacterized protein n=1 Tax=Tritrichomonas foetus TaxID=1144522 RepID=A0A1J4KL75_9EUKA|nr:hypothetical protein TRFO_20129 [Tritrichomonas foetus]|eukprot:OHT10540.1 hypothetical protein TRFO_20129 [Tritrichomonas foetus]
MKCFIPSYEGGGITSLQFDNDGKTCHIFFNNEEIARKFIQSYDLFKIGGREVVIPTKNLSFEDINPFHSFIRTSLCNVIINGNINDDELLSKYQNIYKINHMASNITIVTFQTIEDASNFEIKTKQIYDAAVLNFPPPNSTTYRYNDPNSFDNGNSFYKQNRRNMPFNSVTTISEKDLSFSSLLDAGKNLAKLVEAANLPRAPNLKTLNIFNVVDRSIVENNDALQIVSKDMLLYCQHFGKVLNIHINKPKYEYEKYGVIQILFSNSLAAHNCQIDIAGKIYLGNIVITQLS